MAKSEQVNVYMRPDLRERVKRAAKEAHIPAESLMISILVENALDALDAAKGRKKVNADG